MQVIFTPTSTVPAYRINHNGETFAFTKAGVFTVPDELGAVLLSKRPELFGVKDPGGNTKAVEAPTSNRMFSKPKRNK